MSRSIGLGAQRSPPRRLGRLGRCVLDAHNNITGFQKCLQLVEFRAEFAQLENLIVALFDGIGELGEGLARVIELGEEPAQGGAKQEKQGTAEAAART